MPLGDEKLRQIRGAVRGRFPGRPPDPSVFAPWLARAVPDWASADAPADACAAAGCAFAWGPGGDVLPPGPVIAEVARAAAFDGGDRERAVERAFVRGLRFPLTGGGWESRWGNAFLTLIEWVRQLIVPELQKLYPVVGDRTLGREEWVAGEAISAAMLSATALVKGCECWRRADTLTLTDALANCLSRHRLAAWDGRQRLERHLRRAVLGGVRWPQVNGLRHGVLFPTVAGGRLRAGPVLRCARKGCPGGDIAPRDDSCESCRRPTTASEPVFWAWADGDRVPAECRRCRDDGVLYFRHADAPERGWVRPTDVWVRIHHAQGVDRAEARGPAPDARPIDADRHGRLVAAVAALADPASRRLAERLLLEGESPSTAAARLGYGDLTDPAFLEALRPVARAVRQLIDPVPPPAGADVRGRERFALLVRCLLDTTQSLASVAGHLETDTRRLAFREDAAAVLIITISSARGDGPSADPGPDQD